MDTPPIPRKDSDCRFKSPDFCSLQIVNSIGNQWNSRTNPSVRLNILRDQIHGLNAIPSGYPLEIVVIDDGSDRATVDFLTDCYHRGLINMLFLNKTAKIGNCFSKNIGLCLAEAHQRALAGLPREGCHFKQTGDRSFSPKYIALAENDVVPLADGWLDDLINVIEANEDIGFVNSIAGPFSESDYHQTLRTRQWKNLTLEFRRQIPGSFFLCSAERLSRIGNYTSWDFTTRGQTAGYEQLNIPEEYRWEKWYGSWDEEFCMRCTHHRLFGVNVVPPRLEHRIVNSFG